MDQLSSVRPRAGRPTREQAEARHALLLETALDHFLDRGFELATIEAIAADVGMTKRTVYARYPTKVALFEAAVDLAIERFAVTEERLAQTEAGDIEQTLRNIARLRMDQVMTPDGLKLQRIINTESYRFPDLFDDVYERGSALSVRYLASLFARETAAGRLAIEDPEHAAFAFLSLAVSGPVRIVVSGKRLPEAEIDRRIDFAVRLFLDGARPR
jgi:TetR/AcrR family transcriptional regulator, mexJK operon transcriptional repressor